MSDLCWDISGPGIQRVIQEAVKERKNTMFVYEADSTGQLLRVGYSYIDAGSRLPNLSNVTWLDPDKVQFRKVPTCRTAMHAKLDVAFTKPDGTEVYTLIHSLSHQYAGVRLRSLLRKHGAGNTSFVIQVEIKMTETAGWKEAIRYDCARNIMHRDMIPKDGKPYRIPLETQEGKAAIKQAFTELKASCSAWLSELGYLPTSFFQDDAEIKRSIDIAERKLLQLWEDPRDMPKETSHFIQFKNAPDVLERIELPNSSQLQSSSQSA